MDEPIEGAKSTALGDLAARVDALVARVAELEAENRRLAVSPSAGTPASSADAGGTSQTSRRGALKWVAASAAGAVAGATALGAEPAAAASGSFTGNPAVSASAAGTGTAIEATVENGSAIRVTMVGGGPSVGGGNGTGMSIRSSAKSHIHMLPYGVSIGRELYPSGGGSGAIHYDGKSLWLGTTVGYRRMAGERSAGAFHPWAERAYDSRPGTSPSTGSKTPLASRVARTIDLGTALWEGNGVVGVLLTVHVVNPRSGNGNLTLWPNGGTPPNINHLLWTRAGDRVSITTYCGVASRKLQVRASAATDLVIDVLGYYM